MDFQSLKLEELQLMEDMRLYPPRFLIRVSGSAAAENSRAIFTFQGAIKTIVKEVILNKGKVLLIPYHINMNISCLDTNVQVLYCMHSLGGETIVQEATKACLGALHCCHTHSEQNTYIHVIHHRQTTKNERIVLHSR